MLKLKSIFNSHKFAVWQLYVIISIKKNKKQNKTEVKKIILLTLSTFYFILHMRMHSILFTEIIFMRNCFTYFIITNKFSFLNNFHQMHKHFIITNTISRKIVSLRYCFVVLQHLYCNCLFGFRKCIEK